MQVIPIETEKNCFAGERAVAYEKEIKRIEKMSDAEYEEYVAGKINEGLAQLNSGAKMLDGDEVMKRVFFTI